MVFHFFLLGLSCLLVVCSADVSLVFSAFHSFPFDVSSDVTGVLAKVSVNTLAEVSVKIGFITLPCQTMKMICFIHCLLLY